MRRSPRPHGRRSLRFRLTAIVTGLFALALIAAGVITRQYLRDALEDDARDAATALLDDFLTPSEQLVPTIDQDEITRWLYLDADGEPIPSRTIDEMFVRQLTEQLPDGAISAGAFEGPAILPLDPTMDVIPGTAIVSGPIRYDTDGEPIDEALTAVETTIIDFPFADPGPVREIDLDEAIAVGRDVTLGDRRITVVVASPASTIDDSVATVTRLGMVGIPILTILVAVIAWLVTARTLRPVEAIRRQVERTDPSRLDHHVPRPGGGDEIDRLAGTMNEMLDRLHAASVQQRRFVSDASHELRSPITATIATVEAASAEQAGERWPELAATIVDEQRRLNRLVDDLLLLAELDERRTEPAIGGSVDLDELVLEEVARPRAVPVHAHVDQPHRVPGSTRLIGRAIANLVDNAARHAERRVDVTVTTDPSGHAVVRVDDDGCGVPEGDRDRIRDRFARLDDARRRHEGGAGLGLAIVDEIADRHGARLVVGDSPSGGARFEIVWT